MAGTPLSVAELEKSWLDSVRGWCPNIDNGTSFLPALTFSPILYRVERIADEDVLVPISSSSHPGSRHASGVYPSQPSPPGPQLHPTGTVWTPPPLSTSVLANALDSDVLDYRTVKWFLQQLQVLGESQKEMMMVISGLDFSKYLDFQKDPKKSHLCTKFPRPADHPDTKYRRGDFDVLIIHKQYGLIIAEVKSIGNTTMDAESLKKKIAERVKRAVEQLNKEEGVLKHLVSDMHAPGLHISKTIILPYITARQLEDAIAGDTALEKSLCGCLGTKDLSSAIRRCLCKASPLTTLPSFISLSRFLSVLMGTESTPKKPTLTEELLSWWQCTVVNNGTNAVYEQLLARFCGPATTVDIWTATEPRKVVRSLAEAAAETGLRMCSLVLYPKQIDLLNEPHSNPDCMFLLGPAGTGKTVVLTLRGMLWLQQKKQVEVVSICKESRAVSILIQRQLQTKAQSDDQVHLHNFLFSGCSKDNTVSAAIGDLKACSQDGELYIIVDEIRPEFSCQFTNFCQKLFSEVPTVSLWCAGLQRLPHLPTIMREEVLDIPMRTPPAVETEVAKSGVMGDTSDRATPPYSARPSSAPTDGPEVKYHQHDQGQKGHGPSKNPADCTDCAEYVHAELENHVRTNGCSGALSWRDVLILCDDPSEDLALVKTLRAHDIPVKVLTHAIAGEDVRDFALAKSDEVVVTHHSTASGLERRVVVGLGGVVGGQMTFPIYIMIAFSLALAMNTTVQWFVSSANEGLAGIVIYGVFIVFILMAKFINLAGMSEWFSKKVTLVKVFAGGQSQRVFPVSAFALILLLYIKLSSGTLWLELWVSLLLCVIGIMLPKYICFTLAGMGMGLLCSHTMCSTVMEILFTLYDIFDMIYSVVLSKTATFTDTFVHVTPGTILGDSVKEIFGGLVGGIVGSVVAAWMGFLSGHFRQDAKRCFVVCVLCTLLYASAVFKCDSTEETIGTNSKKHQPIIELFLLMAMLAAHVSLGVAMQAFYKRLGQGKFLMDLTCTCVLLSFSVSLCVWILAFADKLGSVTDNKMACLAVVQVVLGIAYGLILGKSVMYDADCRLRALSRCTGTLVWVENELHSAWYFYIIMSCSEFCILYLFYMSNW